MDPTAPEYQYEADFAAADAEVDAVAEWLHEWTNVRLIPEPCLPARPWRNTPLPVRRIVARQLLRLRKRFGRPV